MELLEDPCVVCGTPATAVATNRVVHTNLEKPDMKSLTVSLTYHKLHGMSTPIYSLDGATLKL